MSVLVTGGRTRPAVSGLSLRRPRAFRLVLSSPHGAFAVVALTLVGGLVLLAPYLHTYNPDRVDVMQRFAGPSWSHLLGTDWLGRDELSRLLYGGRASLGAALVVAVAAAVVGSGIGVVVGYVGGILDTLVMRIVDSVMALPAILVAFAILAVLGPGFGNLILAMVSTWWVGYARVVRARVLVLREQPFVDAARAIGSTRARIMVHHILRGVRGELTVYFGLDFAGALLGVASFSFLGLGVNPPTPEWGSMLSAAEPYQARDPWLMVIPGLAVGLVALSAYLLADRVRDVVDPGIQAELMSWGGSRPAPTLVSRDSSTLRGGGAT
jgi:peptide/nickel transport system permease protein